MWALPLLLVCAAARAEEIRIEVAHGLRSARIEQGGRSQVVTPAEAPLSFDGPVLLEGRELPGKLELFADRGRLVAVNSVDLEQYVAAVVASEVPPSWPAEVLKAQAVAARTFAVAQKIASGPAARMPPTLRPAPSPPRKRPPARCSPGASRPSPRISAPAAAA